jgi:ABC-type multidrug transport system ATPase subunit
MLISGKEVDMANFKKSYGFVPQADIMCREMTVREIIQHSARIRLPSSWSPAEVEHHVDTIIATLK